MSDERGIGIEELYINVPEFSFRTHRSSLIAHRFLITQTGRPLLGAARSATISA